MRGIIFWLALLPLILSPAGIQAQVVYSNEHVELIKLGKGFYLVKENYGYPVNCVVIEGESDLLLLDSGKGEMAEYLADALISLGKPVSTIVNSHADADHKGGNQMFGDKVLVFGHRNCEASFGTGGQQFQPIGDSHSFTFGGMPVFCISYNGGHSECDIMTYIPDLNMAYLGDLFLSESLPQVLLSEGSSAEVLLEHLNEIFESLPDGTMMIPGHGKQTSLEYFGGYILLVEETIEVVRKKMKAGWSLQKIQEEDVLSKWEKWGSYLPGITKESWIEQVVSSYSN